jgi:hypothetical protein
VLKALSHRIPREARQALASSLEEKAMSAEPEVRSAQMCRRRLVQNIAIAGLLGAACYPAEAQPKISKVAVNYQDHPDGDKRCDKCVQFQPPDACKVVEGSISPQGSCRIFVPGHPRT